MKMNKNEFLERLRKGLAGLPEDDLSERLDFYGEMIDDRVEEGLSEEEAILEIGSPEEIAWQIIADYPLGKLVKKKMKPKRSFRAWEIVLLVLGSPVWLPLLAAAVVVALSLYVSVWAIIVSLWAVFASFAGTAFGGLVSGIAFISIGNTLTGAAMIGACLLLSGLSIFTFFGCKAATKGILLLTKKAAIGIKNLIIGKGDM
ncbi:MAG: DUF1700 domain-containing protein [Clostridia bacterium]|nr:DUF1700 domain-containing protein [Clostridia bacterium]